MKIYFNTLNYSNPSFTCNSKKFRKDCSQRIQDKNFTETQIRNLRGLAEKFSSDGLTYEQCLKVARTNPFMLVQKSETMEYNIREFADLSSEYGVTAEGHLKNALRHPPLFSMSPETLKNGMKEKAQLFEADGLTIEELFKMAKSQPNVYTINARTLDDKVDQIAKEIGCTRADVLEIFKSHPTTCSLDTQEIIRKFKFLKYIEQNKFFDAGKGLAKDSELTQITLRKSLTNSMGLNYLILLRNKISAGLPNGSKLPFDHLKDAVSRFIRQNDGKIIELRIPADNLAKDFIAFVEKFSKSIAGKNIFNIKLV